MMKIPLTNLSLLAASTLAFVALAHSQTSQTTQLQSQNNLQKLGVALTIYAEDYDGKLPPMQSATKVKEVLFPYVRDESVFLQPKTGRSYLPNPFLSEQQYAKFNDYKTKVIAFSEPVAARDGSRNVLFLPFFNSKIIHMTDNRDFVKKDVKRLSRKEWLKITSVKR